MSDILLEVDEALRAQQIKALWDKYGQVVIGLAVALVLASGIGVFWQNHMDKKYQKTTAELLSILDSNADDKELIKKLTALKEDSASPLKGIVGMYAAQTQEQAGDVKGARATYQDIAKNGASPSVRELAVIQDVRLGIVLKDAPQTLLNTIEKSTAKDAPFRNSALELKGILLLQTDKKAEAKKIFEALSTDTSASETLRQRAKALMHDGEKTNVQ